jgi:Mn2+/Fe2+ NRAMP family transporter
MTGEKLGEKKPDTFLVVGGLIIGIIATLIVPFIGMVAGLYLLIKGPYKAEALILLFTALVGWMMWVYVW